MNPSTGLLAVLAFVLPIPIPLPFLRPLERTDQAAWQLLTADFSTRGIDVVGDHPRCSEPGLYGLYVRGRREVVVCERGDRSGTLRHEGWHLVQSLCLKDQPWLSSEQIKQRLNRQDRLELHALVQPERWAREAEARAMANLRTNDYLAELDRACAERLPRMIS